MTIHDYPPSALTPHYLSVQEQDAPLIVLEALFDFAHLPSLRLMLWEWLSVTIKGSYNHKDCNYRQRDSIVLCYDKMLKLIEASWLLVKQCEPVPNHEQISDTTISSSSEGLYAEVEKFFQAHPPARLLSTVRMVLLEYIGSEFQIGVPLGVKTIMWDFSDLFELLEKAAKHFPLVEE
jgi:hypothetical protein